MAEFEFTNTDKGRKGKFNTDFREVRISQCANCRHAREDNTCAAFPNGIPLSIIENQFLHETPHPSQNNDITYETTGPTNLIDLIKKRRDSENDEDDES